MESRFKPVTLLDQVKNFYHSMVKVVHSPKKLADRRDVIYRTGVCEQCEFRSNSFCKVCGCYIKLKCCFFTEKCPKGKW